MVQVGVDLRKRMPQIAVLTEEGEIAQRRLTNDPERLDRRISGRRMCRREDA